MQILDLHPGHLLTLTPGAAQRVQVLYGRVWLTETGRSEDVFAASGESIELSPRGLALVEGLGFARIAVLSPATSRGAARVRDWSSMARIVALLARGWRGATAAAAAVRTAA